MRLSALKRKFQLQYQVLIQGKLLQSKFLKMQQLILVSSQIQRLLERKTRRKWLAARLDDDRQKLARVASQEVFQNNKLVILKRLRALRQKQLLLRKLQYVRARLGKDHGFARASLALKQKQLRRF